MFNIIRDEQSLLEIVFEVTSELDNSRLDVFLSEQLKSLEDLEDTRPLWFNAFSVTRSLVSKAISEGGVCVNDNSVSKNSLKVKTGQVVSIKLENGEPLHLSPDENVPFEVVFEDADLLVVNKPSGLVVHPGSGIKEGTLVNGLLHHLGKDFESVGDALRPGVVHRLDKDTSGLMLVAKSQKSLLNLQKQFQDRSIKRRYKALVLELPEGSNDQDKGKIESLIGRDPNNRVKMAVVEEGGKPAVTNWQVDRVLEHGLLLDVSLETGRTHQIRVHLQSAGAAIVGDLVYSCNPLHIPKQLVNSVRAFGRQALHAYSLEYIHPSSGESMSHSVDVQTDMAELIEKFNDEV